MHNTVDAADAADAADTAEQTLHTAHCTHRRGWSRGRAWPAPRLNGISLRRPLIRKHLHGTLPDTLVAENSHFGTTLCNSLALVKQLCCYPNRVNKGHAPHLLGTGDLYTVHRSRVETRTRLLVSRPTNPPWCIVMLKARSQCRRLVALPGGELTVSIDAEGEISSQNSWTGAARAQEQEAIADMFVSIWTLVGSLSEEQ
ncbi:hypothetical protein EKO04_011027 [Ascochyta lentis]|uniref:Uncharacterized protein n=1 Tax=Ascochyta lentis TaxID=205686 RepID=A0A8H7MF83_9PLEO|nr:hypothetical protein EKO04_011027 [Ascochyta lentis]